MTTKKGSVTVTLAGQRFTIRSDHSEAHLVELASYVDRKIRELQRVSKTAGGQQLALLAAMNIADELFAAEKRRHDFKESVQRKGEQMLRAVETAMQAARRQAAPPAGH